MAGVRRGDATADAGDVSSWLRGSQVAGHLDFATADLGFAAAHRHGAVDEVVAQVPGGKMAVGVAVAGDRCVRHEVGEFDAVDRYVERALMRDGCGVRNPMPVLSPVTRAGIRLAIMKGLSCRSPFM